MVRALLDGSKTQTRRIVKPQPVMYEPGMDVGLSDYTADMLVCPYGRFGDRLWVRETHRAIWGQSPGYLIGVDYKADPQEKWERMRDHMGRPKWTPSIHMRREYSRILLEIVSVRVERLNDISEDDCWAEGIDAVDGFLDDMAIINLAKSMVRSFEDAAPTFAALWESINGASSWAANPWVWAIEFKRVTP